VTCHKQYKQFQRKFAFEAKFFLKKKRKKGKKTEKITWDGKASLDDSMAVIKSKLCKLFHIIHLT
jgi:hypothetical protein